MTDETTEEKAPEYTKEELKIRAAFTDKASADADEATVKMAMLKAGCKIKAVGTTYTKLMVESGFLASKDDKDAALKAACADADLSTQESFDAVVAVVTAALKGGTDTASASLVRRWAKANEQECWAKPAGATRQDGFRYKYYQALIANPAMTHKEAKAFGAEHGSENDKKAWTHYRAICDLVNTVSGNAEVNADSVDEAEDEQEAA